MWPEVIHDLSHDCRVIALDCRGHGKSDKPTDPSQYGIEMVNDVVRLMDHLGIAKAHIIGYSMGGSIVPENADGPARAVPHRRQWRQPRLLVAGRL